MSGLFIFKYSFMKAFFIFVIFMSPYFAFGQDTVKLSYEAQEMLQAGEKADSVARAELAQYQKKHRGQLTRSQLNLSAYKRSYERFNDGKSHFYIFDYDYNLPVGGVVYLLHFTVTVSPRTGRTAFKSL